MSNSLKKYENKRHFDKTPEPKGGNAKGQDLHFVIQKHDASRLHYDFRLEMDGVLKSWAIPKGLSLDPAVKRLAMQVEDHPYDYKDFEGLIPAGNYGAGTVIVWDEGTYEPINESSGKNKKAKEKALLNALDAGDLKFRLHGHKVQGEFALVKTHGSKMAENAWLLIKHKDEAVSKKDVTKLDKSVISGKSIEQMKKAPDKTYGNTSSKATSDSGVKIGKQKIKAKNAEKGKLTSKKKDSINGRQVSNIHEYDDSGLEEIFEDLPAVPMPDKVEPMLATLVDQPFDDKDWDFEIKWDGYRAIAYIKVNTTSRAPVSVDIRSRNQKDFGGKYYSIKKALEKFDTSMVLDGELVVVDAAGIPQFGALQNWRSEADGQLIYYVFDLLWLKGKSLMDLPVTIRQSFLKEVITNNESDNIRIGYCVQERGKQFLESAAKLGLEGMVAKYRNSNYQPGHRSRSWLKIKVEQRQEVVIIGYTLNKGSSKKFSSLLLGIYDRGKLKYAGKVGTGFSEKDQQHIIHEFKDFITKSCPLNHVPALDQPSRFRPAPPGSTVTWLEPHFVGEISYRERTADGLFRHPSFKGLRPDKAPAKVVMEEKEITSHVLKQNKVAMKKSAEKINVVKQKRLTKNSEKNDNHSDTQVNSIKRKLISPVQKDNDSSLLNPTEKSQVKKVGGHEMKFTNLDKLYWKKEKIEKRALINYYYQMAPFILPYLKGRPQSLNRFPDGISGENFYQKDVTGKVPDWIQLFLYHSEGDKKDKHFLVVDGLSSLLYMASLGCIEMNPWSSTVKKPDNPTWCIIDLDPDKKKKGQQAFDEVIKAANVTHGILQQLGVEGYPKTSGASGIHIYIPLGNKYSYEQSKIFARLIVSMVHDQLPGITTLERSVADREGKMYLDFLQNRPQATIAAPYCVRPKPGATVSMPLDWSEVKPGLKREDFTINNALERVKKTGDLFKAVLGKGINLKEIFKKIE